MLNLPYSRMLEQEADQVGLHLVAKVCDSIELGEYKLGECLNQDCDIKSVADMSTCHIIENILHCNRPIIT